VVLIQSPWLNGACCSFQWIKVLSGDVKAIFWAPARASEAVAYMNGLQSTEMMKQLRTSAGINNPSNQVDPT